MKYSVLRALPAFCALFLFSGFALAAPVALDSEQKANMASSTILRVDMDARNHFGYLVDSARELVHESLALVASHTTPAALSNAPDGLSLACGTSGSLHVRMARTFPRTVRFTWQSCKFTDSGGNQRERNGKAEVVLVSATFAPDKVLAIRVGESERDFTDWRYIVDEDQITDETSSMNLRLVGVIPLKRAFGGFSPFVGNFAFETTGFRANASRAEFPGSEQPPYHQSDVLSAEHVMASGSITYNDAFDKSKRDLHLHWGTFSSTIESDFSAPSTRSYSIEGLRLRSDDDYSADNFLEWRFTRWIDGKVNYRFPENDPWNPGCVSGDYTVKTLAPVTEGINGLPDGGALKINRSALLRFYSATTVPPELPTPQQGLLIQLDAQGVGSFTYDTFWLRALSEVGQCGL